MKTRRRPTNPPWLAGIEIAAEDLKVVVSPSPDEQVHLSYWESALDATTIEVDGGMLRFRHTVSDSWLDNFIHGFWSSFARYRHVIEIKIPASFAGSLSVTNENAALEASGLTGALLRRLPLQKWCAGAHGHPLPGRADGRDHQRPSLPRPGPRRNGPYH